jgi:hypothetical protein
MDLALRIDSYTSDESKGEMRLMTNVDELGFAPCTVKLQDACNYA